jgi:hypothetical protein
MNAQQGAHPVYPPARSFSFTEPDTDCAPTGQRSTPPAVTSVPNWSYLLLCPVQIQHNPHFIWTSGLYVISCTRNRVLRVSNIVLEGQGPLLHMAPVVPLGKECQVSSGNSSTYLPKTVAWIYWTEFQGSTGNSSRDQMKTVPVSYWKQFQVPIWRSFRYLFERVPSTYWKECQGSTGKISSDRLETVPDTYFKEFHVFI